MWTERCWQAFAACAALAIVGFYVSRLGAPLPLFAGTRPPT